MKSKILVIGLDGGSFELLKPWIEQGELPFLKGTMDKGISGELESVVPPVTAPAWNSFITGKNPGKHGIYDFFYRDKDFKPHPISSYTRKDRAIWEIIGDQGGVSVILNVPTTYPPRELRGALISDFLTPSGRDDFMYPGELVQEIEGKFGKYPLFFKTPSLAISVTDSLIETFLNECKHALKYKFEVAHYLKEKLDPHFLMLHIWESDPICHSLWHVIDRTHPLFEEALFQKHGENILDYFRQFDQEVRRLWEAMGGNSTPLFIISDHGFGPLKKIVDLNVWLLKEGYIALKRDLPTRLKYFLWQHGLTHESLYHTLYTRLIRMGIRYKSDESLLVTFNKFFTQKAALLTIHDVDWSRTRAFSNVGVAGSGQIIINVKGKFPYGMVDPGKEYETLRADLISRLKALRDPENGQEIKGEIFTRDEVYSGDQVETAPDITFLPMNNSYLAVSIFGFTSNQSITRTWGMSGHHKRKGILFGIGTPLRSGITVEQAKILDLFPTILYLMGIKIPQDSDGRVLEEVISSDFLATNPVEFTSAAPPPQASSPTTTPEEEKDYLKKLKRLGYIDWEG
ncbi:MAG: alkaline phosphatase family protein [Proteobacteria bacterium]|nr:alkaline phosphatase family protein [Pseudomonadota bacterium]